MEPSKIVGYFETRGCGYAVYRSGEVWTKFRGYNWKADKIQRRMPSVNPKTRYHSIGNVYVHRAVALAFIPNPNNLSDVNHKDGNKANNKIENLEWLSRGDNHRHAYANKLKVPASKHIPGRGAAWIESRQKWVAKASLPPRKTVFLGYFDSREEAQAVVEAWWAKREDK